MEDSKDRVIDVLMDVINLVPLDIGTLSTREYRNTTSNDGTTLPMEQFTLLLRREPAAANHDKERRPLCTAK